MKLGRSAVKFIIPVMEWAAALFSIYYCFERGFGDLKLTWLFNISADLICMFIDIFFIMGILFGRDRLGKKYSRFLLICHANFLSLFLDFMSWMADGAVSSRSIILLINTALYISNLCLTAAYAHFIFDMIVDDKKTKKICLIAADVLLAITIVTRLLNIRFGYFFTVDANGVYMRGPYQYLSYIYTVVIELMSVVLLIKSSAKRSQKGAVFAFTIFPFASAVVSIFIYGLSLMYACVLISIVMIYSAFFVEMEEDRNKIIETFEKYISNDIVQKIIDNPSGKMIAGRRYTASAMVCDIRGFTDMSEKTDPESLVKVLNHYFGVVIEIIAEYGGIVTEFLGDGLLCVFGAPTVTDNYAEAAVAAALSIQKKIPEINEWNGEHGYPELQTGIGINTGTMVLGSLGNETRAKYTAVGQTVDRAFEIESCSVGGQVLISASTLRAVKTSLDAEFLVDFVPNPNEFAKIKIYEASRIGEPWNVENLRITEPPAELEKPASAELCVLIGKHADFAIHPCSILAASRDALVIKTPAKLEVLDNIKLTVNNAGTAFAKVESIDDGRVFAVYTSKTGELLPSK